MKNLKLISFAKKLLLVLVSVPLLFVGVISTAVAATIITEVTVLENNTLLRIEGEDFGSEPTVSIGNYPDTLFIVDEDCTLWTSSYQPSDPLAGDCVVVQLPGSPNAFPDGDHLLWLTRDLSDGSCANGKPTSLEFKYTPNACTNMDNNNGQHGKFECSGDTLLGNHYASISLIKNADKIDVARSEMLC